jgi:diguanylate cyclase (GGDEF)-like protein
MGGHPVSHLTYYIVPLALSTAVLCALLVVAWRIRSDPVAPWYAATLVGFLIWTVGYMFEIASPSLDGKIWWANVQFIGIILLPVVWFEVVRRYTGHLFLPRWAATLMGAYVVVSIAVVFSNAGHAFRGAPRLDVSTSPTVLLPDYGWYWALILMPGMYVLVIASLLLLLHAIWRDRQSLYRNQYVLMIAAVLIPIGAGTLYVARLQVLPEFNPAPAVIGISGAIMAYALFRYRLFKVAPLARHMVVESLPDGVIVLDTYDRIVDFNPVAATLFPSLADDALGRPVSEVLSFHFALLDRIGLGGSDEERPQAVVAELSMTVPGDESFESRHFTLALADVRGHNGRLLGHSVLLHDVTRSVELLRQVERLSTTDPLTELLNRNAFLERGEHELTRARRQGFAMWLIVVEVREVAADEFLPSDAGDEMMRACAGVCRRILRAFDLVGRFADRRFVMLLPHLSERDATDIARTLRQAVEGLSILVDGQRFRATASVGVAGTTRVVDEVLADLLAPAEDALRRAVEAGGNRVAVDGWGEGAEEPSAVAGE